MVTHYFIIHDPMKKDTLTKTPKEAISYDF